MDAKHDNVIEAYLKTGWWRADVENGKVYRTRGPRGRRLCQSKEVTTLNTKGYYVASGHHDGVDFQVHQHRILWISANGVPLPHLKVCHRNNNPKDNRISNLYLATNEQNISAAHRDHRFKYGYGERASNSKLTDLQAAEIILRRLEGKTYLELAVQYGMHKNSIGRLCRGQTKRFKFVSRNSRTKPFK